jgi:putative ABC transport system permease protein
MMTVICQQVRHALRMLRSYRRTAIISASMLAVGIGATTAVFSMVNAVLLRPLPYAGADRLVRVSEDIPGDRDLVPRSLLSSDTFDAWRTESRTLEGLAGWSTRSFTLSGNGEPERLRGASVSVNLFSLLHVTPLVGRVFHAGEDRPGNDRYAILSEALWERRFGRDSKVVGQTTILNDQEYSIIGVVPRGFWFPDRETVVWTPLVTELPGSRPGQRMSLSFSALAILKRDVRAEEAEAEGTMMARRIELSQSPRPGPAGQALAGHSSIRLTPLRDEQVADVGPALVVLFCAVLLVLSIAAANAANLMLAHSSTRQRELGVRLAMGATRRAVICQLTLESVIVSCVGGAAGVVLAYGVVLQLPVLAPVELFRFQEVELSLTAVSFAIFLSVAAGLSSGIAPALHAGRLSVCSLLSNVAAPSSFGSDVSHGDRLRTGLVIGEVALATVLLIGSGLLVRSFDKLVNVDPGYDPANVLTARVSLPRTRYRRPEMQVAFWDGLIERLRSLRGVTNVGFTSALPLVPGGVLSRFRVEDDLDEPSHDEARTADVHVISPGYLGALGLRVVSGRAFSQGDREGTPLVLLVNQAFASQYLKGRAVGRRLLGIYGTKSAEVIGVVGDVRHAGLDDEPMPEVYVVQDQSYEAFVAGSTSGAVVVRTDGDPTSIGPILRKAVADLDPTLPPYDVMTMEQRLSRSVAMRKFYAAAALIFAGIALMLATVGVYAALSYTVAQRSREIGIRTALGAAPSSVLCLVLRRGALLILIGLTLGVAVASVVTQLLRGLLFGVSVADPASYIAASAVLGAAGLAACYIPARRATRIDPVAAIRHE